MARELIFPMCALWPWPWRNEVKATMQTLGSWTTIVWNNANIQHNVRELWPGQRLLLYVQHELDIRDMTLSQGHDTSFGWGQQSGKLSTSNYKVVRRRCPEKDFSCMYTMTMTLGQGHDTPLGWGQQSCEIFSRSNLAVRIYGPDNVLAMCTVTLTLEI